MVWRMQGGPPPAALDGPVPGPEVPALGTVESEPSTSSLSSAGVCNGGTEAGGMRGIGSAAAGSYGLFSRPGIGLACQGEPAGESRGLVRADGVRLGFWERWRLADARAGCRPGGFRLPAGCSVFGWRFLGVGRRRGGGFWAALRGVAMGNIGVVYWPFRL